MQTISLFKLSVLLIPSFLVIWWMMKWNSDWKKGLLSIARMLLQLLLIGYMLTWIFGYQNPWVLSAVLVVMLLIAAYIALNTIKKNRRQFLFYSAISVGSVSIVMLSLIVFIVLGLDPWYQPSIVIPIAGMVFSVSMTAISLAAERYFSELEHKDCADSARNKAYSAAMIPTINSLLAVGLVSLPGMMTGQILSGVSPLIAVRYQIMIMLMKLITSGLVAGLFLKLVHRKRS
jgi:putative ABC transport system permease protein